MVSWGGMWEAEYANVKWRTLNNFSKPWGAETESGYLVPGPRQGCGLEWDRSIRGVGSGLVGVVDSLQDLVSPGRDNTSMMSKAQMSMDQNTVK